MERYFPIGTPGQPWGESERQAWFETCSTKRSYRDEVLAKIDALDRSFEISQYGALPLDADRYPLMSVKIEAAGPDAPWVLVTGGVHGYETSGVQGALEFLATSAVQYSGRVNFLVAPCVSPWGYETINRWNPNAVDPNRSFAPASPSEEAAAVMKLVDELGVDFLMHVDLHETTDTDESEFRPALAAREGEPFEPGTIPDGFYTVGDSNNLQPDFQAAIITAVEQVTHIAPADNTGEIIGTETTQHGVINYPYRDLGLCAGMTNARFTSTTEVYPDSPRATPEICNDAQLAALHGALDFVLSDVANSP